jgi:predicted transposase/invertase (TIGR01784 family)
MTPLKYKLTHDLLFKMLFVKYPQLLKHLVAELLCIPVSSITEFKIINAEIPPEALGDKFCRLDINMRVNGQLVDLEVQIDNEGNYPDRSLFIWAKEVSSSISMGGDYINFPRTIVISILGFNQFKAERFHHEFQCLETTTHQPLTDKMVLHFYEIKKLPPIAEIDKNNLRSLWLKLFKAESEEDLAKIQALEVPVMSQALQAYRHVSASDEFKEKERMWAKARHDEARALAHARLEERLIWQDVLADKDKLIKELQTALAKRTH